MAPQIQRSIVRIRHGTRSICTDPAVVEAPLEVRLHGEAFAVLMRTPGNDRELAAGFLLAERVVRHADELGSIEHCVDRESAASVVNVIMDEAHAESVLGRIVARRELLAGSSCGVCGRATLDAMETGLEPIASDARVSASVVAALPDRLRSRQPIFESTGGLHAAAVFDANGTALAVAEDVGRHNAVDKAVGSLLLAERLPLSRAVLCVSGRTSYEILQKAWCAGIPIVAAVSAPSSLAIELAERAGIALAGFVRDGGLNIYAHAERIV
jgi:FdhD protein